MFLLLVLYAAIGNTPADSILIQTEFPLATLEARTELAETMAVDSMLKDPELAPYKFYTCVKESI